MPELTIRKDRTPVMLRKLANAAEERGCRGGCWRSPTRSTA